MKILFASALTALTGLGVFTAQAGSADEAPCPKDFGDCAISAERLPDGTCQITCEGPEGTCAYIIDCDEPCEPQDCELAPKQKSACEAVGDCAG
jgi:hypothetical protein